MLCVCVRFLPLSRRAMRTWYMLVSTQQVPKVWIMTSSDDANMRLNKWPVAVSVCVENKRSCGWGFCADGRMKCFCVPPSVGLFGVTLANTELAGHCTAFGTRARDECLCGESCAQWFCFFGRVWARKCIGWTRSYAKVLDHYSACCTKCSMFRLQ